MRKSVAVRMMLLLGVVYPALASAAELYRYVDERGVVVLDRHGVPPQHISRGYQVLNEQGRVIRVVPPAPSAEEFARLQAQKARDASDAQLLRLYASVEDVERAETRKLAELGSVIGLARGNLQSIRNQRSSLQKQAANHERAGRKVPDNLLGQIKNLEKEEQSLLRDLTRFEKARADAEVSFANDRQRVAELLGQTQ